MANTQIASGHDAEADQGQSQLMSWPRPVPRSLSNDSQISHRLSGITFTTSSSRSSGSAFIDYIHSRKDITGRRINPKVAKLRKSGLENGSVDKKSAAGQSLSTAESSTKSKYGTTTSCPPPPAMHRRNFSHQSKPDSGISIPSVYSYLKSFVPSLFAPSAIVDIDEFLESLGNESEPVPDSPAGAPGRSESGAEPSSDAWEIWNQLDSPDVVLISCPAPALSQFQRLPRPLQDRFMRSNEIYIDSLCRSIVEPTGYRSLGTQISAQQYYRWLCEKRIAEGGEAVY
jgi:hypothetical protein